VFASKSDFPASVHADILDALTKGNDVVIEDNIDRAVSEMRAYLNSRYKPTTIEAIFNAEGTNRNKFLLRLCISMSLYYIYLAHNPRKLTQHMADEFERSIETLKGIQSGKITPDGIIDNYTTDETTQGTGNPIQWGGSPALGMDW
jgi:phage gp36-like protein